MKSAYARSQAERTSSSPTAKLGHNQFELYSGQRQCNPLLLNNFPIQNPCHRTQSSSMYVQIVFPHLFVFICFCVEITMVCRLWFDLCIAFIMAALSLALQIFTKSIIFAAHLLLCPVHWREKEIKLNINYVICLPNKNWRKALHTLFVAKTQIANASWWAI